MRRGLYAKPNLCEKPRIVPTLRDVDSILLLDWMIMAVQWLESWPLHVRW